MRVVLDANVVISAAIRPSGPPGLILRALLEREAFELVLSHAIVSEVEHALGQRNVRSYLAHPDDTLALLADLVALADLVDDTGRVVGVSRDPADDRVLAAALEGRADLVVTGDGDLLDLGEHEGVAILTPRAFLDLLER